MKKYFMIVEKVKDADRIEPILKFKGIKFERLGPTKYHIWTTERTAIELNETFEYVSVIRTEL